MLFLFTQEIRYLPTFVKWCDVCAECRGARLLSLFRFKIWWMIPRVGSSGKDIPAETQMLLLEAREEPNFAEPDGNTAYVLFLPILDGEFRSSLQGNLANELEVCVETGMGSLVCSVLISFEVLIISKECISRMSC